MVAEARSTLEAAQDAGAEVQREREEINVLKHSLAAEQKRVSSLEKNIQGREQQIEEEMLVCTMTIYKVYLKVSFRHSSLPSYFI